MTTTATREGAARVSFRAAPETIDEEARSVTATLATENPVEVLDFDTFEFIGQRLVMDGVELPESRQVPLLDSHNRGRVSDQLGSIRDLRIEEGEEGSELVGDLHFDTGEAGETAFRLIKGGHLRDVSVGFGILSRRNVPEGETEKINGREFEGPAQIVTAWSLSEASVTPIGADQAAKIRSKKFAMTEQASGAERAKETVAPPSPPAQHPAPVPVEPTEEQRAAIKKQGAADERARQAEIRASGQKWVDGPFSLDPKEVEAAITGGQTVEEAGQRFLKWIEENQTRCPVSAVSGRGAFAGDGAQPSVRVEGDENADLVDALSDSIILRANPGRKDKLHPRAPEFARMKTREIAAFLAQRAGKKVNAFTTQDDIFRAAGGGSAGERAPAMLGTANLPNVLANVLNKSAGIGFAEAPVTWPLICRRMMANDLRPHPMPKMSQIDSLAQIGEHGEVKTTGLSDKQEQITPSTWARRIVITDDAVINDDLGMLSDIPMKLGQAAARTVEDFVYYTLLSNPTLLEDATAVFTAGHNNLAGAGGAPSETTFNAATAAMSKQRSVPSGPNDTGELLDLRPAILLHGPSLASTVNKQLNSEWLPGATNETRNPFQGAFTPVMSPRLEEGVTVQLKAGPGTVAGSLTAWYLFAAQAQIESLIVAFVGSDTPETMEERPIGVIGTDRRVVLRFGVAFGDYRGAYLNPGA